LTIGHVALGISNYNLGNPVVARAHFERASAAWEPDFPRLQLDLRVAFLGFGALTLQQLGDAAEAAAWIHSLIEYARDLEDPINAANPFGLVGRYQMWGGTREEPAAWADRSLHLSVEHGFPIHEPVARINKGSALGDLPMQRDAFAALRATGSRVGLSTYR